MFFGFLCGLVLGFWVFGGVWGLRSEMCVKISDFKCGFYFLLFFWFCVLCVSKALGGFSGVRVCVFRFGGLRRYLCC